VSTAVLTSVRPRSGPDRDAVRDVLPMAVGVAPFGLVLGVAMGELGLATWSAVLGSVLVFGGAAQLVALTLAGSGAGVAAVVLSTLLVNARLALYGASLAHRFRGQPGWFRWLAPHLIVDQLVAISALRPDLDRARFRRYWLSAAGVLSVGWFGAIVTGLQVGPVLPADAPLDVATAALFVGLVVPRLSDRATVVAAAIAVAVAIVSGGWPSGTGLVLAIVLGVAGGVLVTGRESRP
jgi:4-azaleucine resistance transporter AzlC